MLMLMGMNLMDTVEVVVCCRPAQSWTLTSVPLTELLDGQRLHVSEPISKLRLNIRGWPSQSV